MGRGMSQNLMKTFGGENVSVFDLNVEAVKELEALGAQRAFSVSEMARSCDVLVTMLPETSHVAGVVRHFYLSLPAKFYLNRNFLS
jgi:2-hydroxy-3-oxopropionate reductase